MIGKESLMIEKESLYDLVNLSKMKDSLAIQKIIDMMKPKIKKELHNVPLQEREDLEQELKLDIIEAVYNYEMEVPSFWSVVCSDL